DPFLARGHEAPDRLAREAHERLVDPALRKMALDEASHVRLLVGARPPNRDARRVETSHERLERRQLEKGGEEICHSSVSSPSRPKSENSLPLALGSAVGYLSSIRPTQPSRSTMRIHQEKIDVRTDHQGPVDVTERVRKVVRTSGVDV